MRSKFFFGIAAMLLLASCEESFEMETNLVIGNRSEVFTATTETEPSTRTSLSGYTNGDGCYSLYWDSGDAISICDGANTAVYTTDGSYTSSADFVRSEGKISNTAAHYEAFYPSSITTTNMILPANQNYVDGNIENFPMRAVSTNKNLAFKNLCGIIRFSIKSDETGSVNISKISLSSDNLGLSGEFTIDDDYAAVVKGTDGIVLTCTESVSLYKSVETDFNIVVPKGSYNPLKVKVVDENGREINLESQSAIDVKRSEITKIRLTLSSSTFDSSLEMIPITESDVEFTDR